MNKRLNNRLNILITGGAGFIGTHLYNQLKENHNVTRIDNFKTSYRIPDVIDMDLGNLEDTQLEFIEGILSCTDVVYHFASSIGVDLIHNDPKGTLMNSFNINNNLFPLFEKYQPKVIYASSSEVYGSRNTPMKESDDLIIGSPSDSMRWGYASQKLMSEFLIKSYSFPHTIVRFFNVTGVNQRANYGMVLPRFVESATSDEPLHVYGNGEQIRSFCDVRDAVNVLELLITEMEGEILNIGNPKNTISMISLATMTTDLSSSKSDVVMNRDERKGEEIHIRVPDCTKMNTIYTPIYTLKDIIDSMLEAETKTKETI